MLGLVGYGGGEDEEPSDVPQTSQSQATKGQQNPKKRKEQVEFTVPRPSKQMKLADDELLRQDAEEERRREEQVQSNLLADKKAGLGLLASLPKPKQAPTQPPKTSVGGMHKAGLPPKDAEDETDDTDNPEADTEVEHVDTRPLESKAKPALVSAAPSLAPGLLRSLPSSAAPTVTASSTVKPKQVEEPLPELDKSAVSDLNFGPSRPPPSEDEEEEAQSDEAQASGQASGPAFAPGGPLPPGYHLPPGIAPMPPHPGGYPGMPPLPPHMYPPGAQGPMGAQGYPPNFPPPPPGFGAIPPQFMQQQAPAQHFPDMPEYLQKQFAQFNDGIVDVSVNKWIEEGKELKMRMGPISSARVPTPGSSRGKHQLSYLAARASADEEKFLNQKAQALATKAQTRSKYGW